MKRNIVNKLSPLVYLSLIFFFYGCSTLSIKEISQTEVPEGLWESEGEIYVSDFQLNDPTVSKVKKSGDCNGQSIAARPTGPASRAYCAETRTLDPVRNCKIVTSTFGEGYCPVNYNYMGSANASSMQYMDSVVSAGTAAQNAVLQWGQNMSYNAQVKARDFLMNKTFSSKLGSGSDNKNYDIISETLISDQESFQELDMIAMTRKGFYSDCVSPKFTFDGAYMGSYYRIKNDSMACKLGIKESDYMPNYYNARSNNKNKVSFIYSLELKKVNDQFQICMNDPALGICAFKKENLTPPDDFIELRGFVQERTEASTFISLGLISSNEIMIKVLENDSDGIGEIKEVYIPSDNNVHEVNGLSIRILEIKEDRVDLEILGKIIY